MATEVQSAAAVEAIKFAVSTDESTPFLCAWLHGDFEAIRKEWPECPKNVFAGADPSVSVAHDAFTLSFNKGLPPALSGPNVYLLYDGSIAMGELVTEDGKKWLKSFNPAGMTPMDIAANKIIGWASAAPRRGFLDQRVVAK
jgi:hypothetical protein